MRFIVFLQIEILLDILIKRMYNKNIYQKYRLTRGGDSVISRYKKDLCIKNNSIDVSIKDIFGSVDMHWHEFYEIEIILDGEGVYTIDGIDYKIKNGSLFFMSPSSFHRINFTKNTRLINFMFTLEICDFDFLCDMFDSCPHISINLEKNDTALLYMLAKDMLDAKSPKHISSILNCLLGKIQRIFNGNYPIIKDTQMQYAVLYIQNHFKEHLRLEHMAAITNYTPNYFSNKFKEYTGVTFKNYITELRISLAKNLLEKTNLSITEICYMCGYKTYQFMQLITAISDF